MMYIICGSRCLTLLVKSCNQPVSVWGLKRLLMVVWNNWCQTLPSSNPHFLPRYLESLKRSTTRSSLEQEKAGTYELFKEPFEWVSKSQNYNKRACNLQVFEVEAQYLRSTGTRQSTSAIRWKHQVLHLWLCSVIG